MRMRKKPNLIPRLERCARVGISEPERCRGRWAERFPGFSELFLELGCGKGRFTADFAAQNPKTLIVAVERVPEAIVVAMERACEKDLTNLRFVLGDAKQLGELFAPGEVSRILLNFCDPWPKHRDAKRRLTAKDFLMCYAQLLPPGGELWFKTDNQPLFEWSIEQFDACGWELKTLTRDLHTDGPVEPMTDYEVKFFGQGVPINRLIAVRE